MNPARTLASAIPSGTWAPVWIYFFAPMLAMLAAGELVRALRGSARVPCAKLDHTPRIRCLFCGGGGAVDSSARGPERSPAGARAGEG